MLADNMAQLAWICDELGNATWYNRRWLEYTGLSLEETKNWAWTKCHHPDHLDRVVSSVSRSRETGEPWEDTFPLRGKDGEYRWFLSRAVPIRNEQGAIVWWFGANTDVTEQRLAQEALREADRRKNQFLATLGHELRNPLAAIKGGVQMLQSNKVGEETKQQMVRIVANQVKYMERLIDDVLDVARIIHGKIRIRPQRLALQDAVERAIDLTHEAIKSKDCELQVRVPSEPVFVDADPVRLAQVISNLISNSVKYSGDNGRIAITAFRQDGEAVVEIEDNGLGISPDLLPDIFDLFVQEDRSTNRSQGGLGLGLTVVKTLVEQQGGHVEAFSEGQGKGSRFRICFPIGGSKR